MVFAAATSHAGTARTNENKTTIIAQTTTATQPKTQPKVSHSVAIHRRMDSKKTSLTHPNTDTSPIRTELSRHDSPRFTRSNGTAIWKLMNKHQHTATFLHDAWNKKRRHKCVQKYAEIKKNARTDRTVIENQNTATLLYDAWNKKRCHKSVQKYDETKTIEQTVSNIIEQNFYEL